MSSFESMYNERTHMYDEEVEKAGVLADEIKSLRLQLTQAEAAGRAEGMRRAVVMCRVAYLRHDPNLPVAEALNGIANEILATLPEDRSFDCESCGGRVLEKRDDGTCKGCGLAICQSCCDVFEHIGDGLHGKGDPAAEMERLRGLHPEPPTSPRLEDKP